MKQWKGFLAGVLFTLLSAGLIVTAAARTETVWQELTYRDIRVSLNGEVLDLRNAIGEPVEPFMFGGTNYLPVRALAEALGLNVAWDGAEVMVVLTTPEPPALEPEASAAVTPEPPASEPETSAEVTPEASAAATVKPETASNEEPEATADTPEPTTETETPTTVVTPKPTPKPSASGGEEENFYTWDIPENAETKDRYVLNLRSKKIHSPDCRTVPLIAPNDYATSNASLEELLADEFTICGVCHAHTD